MGDLSEMRGLVVILSFVGIFVLIAGWIYAESPLIVSGVNPGGTSPTADSSVTGPDSLFAYNLTTAFNITGAAFQEDFELGGWTISMQYWDVIHKITVESYESYLWGLIHWNAEDFKWYTLSNVYCGEVFDPGWPIGEHEWISLDTIDADYAAGNSIQYVLRNSKTEFRIRFTFNTTAHMSPSDALNDGDILYGVVNMDWDERNTSINVLGFISQLFTFSLPGIDSRLQLIIMGPIMVATAYMVFIFSLRIIGAVFGGGGA